MGLGEKEHGNGPYQDDAKTSVPRCVDSGMLAPVSLFGAVLSSFSLILSVVSTLTSFCVASLCHGTFWLSPSFQIANLVFLHLCRICLQCLVPLRVVSICGQTHEDEQMNDTCSTVGPNQRWVSDFREKKTL